MICWDMHGGRGDLDDCRVAVMMMMIMLVISMYTTLAIFALILSHLFS
jgi:hypothetical protein